MKGLDTEDALMRAYRRRLGMEALPPKLLAEGHESPAPGGEPTPISSETGEFGLGDEGQLMRAYRRRLSASFGQHCPSYYRFPGSITHFPADLAEISGEVVSLRGGFTQVGGVGCREGCVV
eukprot:3552993-Rhodomonas_salina.1